MGAFLQAPAPVLDKISGPMGARFLSSTGLRSGNLIERERERAQFFPVKAKSGNLNLFLGILLFFPLFSLQFSRKKGQNTQKKV